MRAFVIMLAGLALASCADSEPVDETDPTPAEAMPVNFGEPRTPAPSPTSTAEAAGDPSLTQGQWLAKTERGVPAALFGPPDSEVLFSVRCEGSELAFGLGVGNAKGPATMEVAAGGKTRSIAVTAQQDPIPHANGRIPADDPFAAVLAQATGPVAISIDDEPVLRFSAHETMRKVVADCRKGSR